MRSLTPAPAVWPGRPYPLGATWDGEGVNFALFSEGALRVELCLFDPEGRHELQRVEMDECTDQIWHCYLPQARPGLAYGYRVHGPYGPERGLRFNPHKLLLDPYAKAIAGTVRWHDALFGYTVGHQREDLSFDRRDSAPFMPKARVVETAFSWGDDRRPGIPWNEAVTYELNVRGFTMRHPEVPEPLRGTYAGLTHQPVIDYLKRLGVTTVELMPVHAFIDDRRLVDIGLRNYWGYNTLSYFAPEGRYSALGEVNEFKTMVKVLHSAGLEVIIDVVYNHTCEGSHLGPTLSLRGVDNAAYYRLDPARPRYYTDFTGCGNTVNLLHPRTLQLVMDSLRYWASEMHVDGFRFDLAPALARAAGGVESWGSFFDVIRQDPVLSRVKLIAEPWDVGQDGYHVGNFPVGWAEWNDRYRDGIRAYWKGDGGLIGEFARRLTGSSDLYDRSGRRPHASINHVTSHDGFTLADLVSYNERHNEANGETGLDGHNHNLSWNCGVEGPSDDAEILALRARQQRNFLATLLLSQGVPMLLAGDEIGRTQLGNNNAYCQDNELSWLDWADEDERKSLLAFTRRLVRLRREHPVFRRRDFFQGRPLHGGGVKDILWLSPDGSEMSDDEWAHAHARCLAVYLSGSGLQEVDRRGRPVHDDDFLMLFNAHHEEIAFVLPVLGDGPWRCVLDTTSTECAEARYVGGATYALHGRSLALLTRTASMP
ncbi:MAG: glycogen debranching enzyme GlgX [Burkholderiales bacterium]|nr:MAG: glycogen debranching enzyme GlgX [Burkholderiales bacterium]